MHAVVIDYGASNLRSVRNALVAACPKEMQIEVSADPQALQAASHIILPGVGAFGDCRAGLDAIPGMVEALNQQVREAKKPFLGVCVGMQLMAQRGLEHGEHTGLGWLRGEVVPIPIEDATFKIPHMGWNSLRMHHPHPVLEGIDEGVHAYFVHSYFMQLAEEEALVASVDYGHPLTALVAKENMVGTQFHPEKSQETGLQILRNFLHWGGE